MAFKLLGKCCRPRRVGRERERERVGKCVEPKMLMQFIGEIKNSGSGKCK